MPVSPIFNEPAQDRGKRLSRSVERHSTLVDVVEGRKGFEGALDQFGAHRTVENALAQVRRNRQSL
jgi:hypothetical protein